MSDTKGSRQSYDTSPHRAEASATTSLKPTQERSSAATQYWQGVAAAGRAAKPVATLSAEVVTPSRQRSVQA